MARTYWMLIERYFAWRAWYVDGGCIYSWRWRKIEAVSYIYESRVTVSVCICYSQIGWAETDLCHGNPRRRPLLQLNNHEDRISHGRAVCSPAWHACRVFAIHYLHLWFSATSGQSLICFPSFPAIGKEEGVVVSGAVLSSYRFRVCMSCILIMPRIVFDIEQLETKSCALDQLQRYALDGTHSWKQEYWEVNRRGNFENSPQKETEAWKVGAISG